MRSGQVNLPALATSGFVHLPADGIDGCDCQSASYLARKQHWSSPEVVPLGSFRAALEMMYRCSSCGLDRGSLPWPSHSSPLRQAADLPF